MDPILGIVRLNYTPILVALDQLGPSSKSYVSGVLRLTDVRPRASFGRMLDDLGTSLLELAYGVASSELEVSGIVIHDPTDAPEIPAGSLVCAIGLPDTESIIELLRGIGDRGAAALVVRAPIPESDLLAAASDETGVAVLGLAPGASWTQLTAIVRSLLAEDAGGASGEDTLGGIPSGDLFALANAISALLDAPVTIEDRSSRVLAYSGRQDESDRSRIETILGRHVPEHTTQMLSSRGIFRELYRSEKPVWQDPLEVDQLPRVAIAVRAGDEVLGSIWAAVHAPLDEERSQALVDASKLAALHMLRIRAGADVGKRLRADLLSTALEGGAGAQQALSRLGLADVPVVVLAVTVSESVGEDGAAASRATLGAERQTISDAFAMHLAAMHPRCATALIGDIAYGLLAVRHDGSDNEGRAVRVAQGFLARTERHPRAVVGVGPVAHGVAGLAHARATADRIVRVLCSRGSITTRVATLADVQAEALMLEFRDLVAARGDNPSGALERLLAYDVQHGAQLVGTVKTWLDAFGDINEASAIACVHPNTFRYRIRRVAEVGAIDLTDPETRFAVMLLLRLLFDK